ncbi:hypothetical protein E4U15_007607 [Claviceps sp. LM218 group G6]|nr:hypothetical protein E4U15_007607 [Claviceps sp. LM218 group G6]
MSAVTLSGSKSRPRSLRRAERRVREVQQSYQEAEAGVNPATASVYVAALRSVHIDLDLPTTLFDGLHSRRLISGFVCFAPWEEQLQMATVR